MKKLWTILLAVLLVTGFALTGCGETPEPPVTFTLTATIPADTTQSIIRIQGADGEFSACTITDIKLTFGPITLWSLADWFAEGNDHIGSDAILGHVGNDYKVDTTLKTISISNSSDDYRGLDISIGSSGLQYQGMTFNVTVTGVATPGSQYKLSGSASPWPQFGETATAK